MAATETVFAFDAISANNPQYTSNQLLNWAWQLLRRNDGVAQDLDLALAVTADGIGNALTQNGAAFLTGRSYLMSGGPVTTALSPAPASGFQTAYAVVVRFTSATATGAIVAIAGSTIANPGPAVNPSIVAATDVLLAYIKAVNTAGTIVYTVTDARTFAGIGPAGQDTFYGKSALSLQYTSTGIGFTAVGFEALTNASTTVPSTGIGFRSLKALTTGAQNTAVGYESLTALTTGTGNTAMGYQALKASTTGVGNTAVGYLALTAATTAISNTAIGYVALQSLTTGIENTAVGRAALSSLTTGTDNTAVGRSALAALTTSIGSTAVGSSAGAAATGAGIVTAVGYQALQANTTPVSNTAVGFQALKSNTTGARNTGIGYQTLTTLTTGSDNLAVGYQALQNSTGSRDTAIGSNALSTNSTGSDNTSIGANSLGVNTTGVDNTAVGSSALVANTTAIQNTAVGSGSLASTTTGVNNTGLGFGAVSTSATASNQITLGNASVTIIRAQVTTITALSDERDKRDINPLPEMLPLIRAIPTVTFRWDPRERYATKGQDGQVKRDEDGYPIYDKKPNGSLADTHATLGVISQQLKKVQEEFNMPYLNLVEESNPNRLEATPANLLLPLIKAVQELAD